MYQRLYYLRETDPQQCVAMREARQGTGQAAFAHAFATDRLRRAQAQSRRARTARRGILLCSSSRPSGSRVHRFYATCPRGLGDVLAREIEAETVQGKVEVIHSSGVRFTGPSISTGYAACLWLRVAIRVLHLVSEASEIGKSYPGMNSYEILYNYVRKAAEWGHLLQNGRASFSVQVRGSFGSHGTPRQSRSRQPGRSRQQHTAASGASLTSLGEHRCQVCAKDAICDALRDAGLSLPERPQSYADADVPLFLAIDHDALTLYRDMAGSSLHKRGYRRNVALHKSSLNEAVAAGMLYLAGFGPDGSFETSDGHAEDSSREPGRKSDENTRKELTLMDPMCGSGTILIEAILCRLRIAPGLYRADFPFQRWMDYDPESFKALTQAALVRQTADEELGMAVYGSDESESAIHLAKRDLARLRIAGLVHLKHCKAEEARPQESKHTLVVCNPPWGLRLGDEREAWDSLGLLLRNLAPGSSAVLLSGDSQVTRGLRLRARRKHPVRIGNVDCRVLMYDIHEKPSESKDVRENPV